MLKSAQRVLTVYIVVQLVINVIVIAVLFSGSLAGAALYGSMMATLGLLSPYLLVTALGVNVSTAGFINLVVTTGWLFTTLGRGTFRENVVYALSVVARLISGSRSTGSSR